MLHHRKFVLAGVGLIPVIVFVTSLYIFSKNAEQVPEPLKVVEVIEEPVETSTENSIAFPEQVYLLPLQESVVFPNRKYWFEVSEPNLVAMLKQLKKGEHLFLTALQPVVAKGKPIQIFHTGSVAELLALQSKGQSVFIHVQGVQRARILEQISDKNKKHQVKVEYLQTINLENPRNALFVENIKAALSAYKHLRDPAPKQVLKLVSTYADNLEYVADSLSDIVPSSLEERQRILMELNLSKRLELAASLVEKNLAVLETETLVHKQIEEERNKSNKRHYLREKMEAMQHELDEIDDTANDLKDIEDKLSKLPEEVKEKTGIELGKLKRMNPMSPEHSQIRSYLEWVVKMPWSDNSEAKFDLVQAEKTFNKSHYGLEKVKDRILEYLVVQDRVKHNKAPILCLVGPPGVGKTSLVKTIAEVTNRKFVKMSLGGVRDEAVIRGFKRTYIGSSPGTVMQKLAKVGVNNPVFLLDEIDKVTDKNYAGDPQAALLEVLDPEQNTAFSDHYLEVDFDLSKVLFITTANSLESISAPLRDRMEIISLHSYTEDEKLSIAKGYLIPKQFEFNGVTAKDLVIKDSALKSIIRYYTREAGVRSLTREIDKIVRKVVRNFSKKKPNESIIVNAKNIDTYLGPQQFSFGLPMSKPKVGIVNGLAYTPMGGDLLNIEATSMPGKGNNTLTGQLGNVMQESIKTAITVARVQGKAYGVKPNFFSTCDIHVHVPEGGIPKDGPSAGIAMATALISALSNTPIRSDLAMTGEITLRGDVLPIGGLKEKVLAAYRSGIKMVIIPNKNKKDLVDIPQDIQKHVKIVPVKHIDEVLKLALVK